MSNFESSQAILQQFSQLLDELDQAQSSQQHQWRIIHYVADVLSSSEAAHSHVVEAAIEAFEKALSRRPDHALKVQVAAVVMKSICDCSSGDQNQSQIVATMLRLLLPVRQMTGFVEDIALQQQCTFILASLLDHPPIRQLLARILAEGFPTSPMFETGPFIAQKAQLTLQDCITNMDPVDPDAIFWLINLLLKHANSLILGKSGDLMLNLARLMRIASSQPSLQQKNQQWFECWRSILALSIQLVERLNLLSFEVVDELIEQLRMSSDDIVAEATLRCLKQFSSTPGDKFFALNCHIPAFKYLTTESLPRYLKMNFRHLLKPAFELLGALTMGPTLPDSSTVSETLMTSILEANRVMQDDSYLTVACAARLIETRFMSLPLVYEPVEALMRLVIEEQSVDRPILTAAACSLATAIASTYDWPGLRSILAISDQSHPPPIQVRFVTLLIDFIRRLVLSTCSILLTVPFDANSWLPFRHIVDAMAVCIEKCHASLIGAIYADLHETPLLFTLLAFKTFGNDLHPQINTVMHALIIDFAGKKIDNWRNHAADLSLIDSKLPNAHELASFLEETLPRLSETMPKLITSRDHLMITLLIAVCSGVEVCSTLLDLNSFRSFLLNSFRKIQQIPSAGLLSYLAADFFFKLALLECRLLPLGVEEELDSFFTSSQNQRVPLWFLIQPQFMAWIMIRQVACRRLYLASQLFEQVLAKNSPISPLKITKILVEIVLISQNNCPFQQIAEFLMSFSLRGSFSMSNWRLFTTALLTPKSWQMVVVLLDKFKSMVLRSCFDAISVAASSSPLANSSRPTPAFLHLATVCLCESPTIAAKFVEEEDRLVLAAFITRLVNTARPNQDQEENELWLGGLNFLNAILIIYWSHQKSAANLRNVALSLGSNEALLNGLLFGITQQESNVNSKSFYAGLVTVCWLYRFLPPGATIRRENVIETKLFKPVSDHFLQQCTCATSDCCCDFDDDDDDESDGDYCVAAMFASLMLDKSRPGISWICSDFAENLLLPRFLETKIKSAIFKVLVLMGKVKDDEENNDDPWLNLSQILAKADKSEKSNDETIVVPVITDGIVFAINNGN